MSQRSVRALGIYFLFLILLSSIVIGSVRFLGEQGLYLVQVYMLMPAVAALFVRLLFYKLRFKDANFRFGKIRDYLQFWALSVGITLFSFLIFTLLGAIQWDPTGSAFLQKLENQSLLSGQDLTTFLPHGFSPRMMLTVFSIGGLTIFKIFPGIVTGFGEEFGHRGMMFPQLYSIKPWIGFVIGGLIWHAWHVPLLFVVPQELDHAVGLNVLNHFVLAIGSICTFTYLAYIYIKSRSIFVAAIGHIALNNAAVSFSYFVVVKNPLLANVGLTLTMLIVVAVQHITKQLHVFQDTFLQELAGKSISESTG